MKMQCPKCQFGNREGAKFCKKCGAKLELACPECSYLLTPDSLFCDECGCSLSEISEKAPEDLSFDEKLTKIQKYLPKGITEKILSQRDRIEGERKHVTVMFCDMEGYTAFSEIIGPEEAYSIMDQVYEMASIQKPGNSLARPLKFSKNAVRRGGLKSKKNNWLNFNHQTAVAFSLPIVLYNLH
jgi:hypothetical protein